MAHDAHDMSLIALIVDGVAHGFTINGQTVVGLSIGVVPALQGLVQMHGLHTDQTIADNTQVGTIKRLFW